MLTTTHTYTTYECLCGGRTVDKPYGLCDKTLKVCVNIWAYKFIYVCACYRSWNAINVVCVQKGLWVIQSNYPAIANWTFVKTSLNTYASIIPRADNRMYQYCASYAHIHKYEYVWSYVWHYIIVINLCATFPASDIICSCKRCCCTLLPKLIY